MKVNLIAIGTGQPSWVQQGFQEYAKRLTHDFTLTLTEIQAEKRLKNSNIKRLSQVEGEKLLKAIPKGNLIITLDERGKLWDSKTLAQQLNDWQLQSRDISLLVGGPDGLSQEVKETADLSWSLSPLTLPHGLVRVIVAEQLYRAVSILHQHPYHRE